jgi:micrococcal nuclease
MIEPKEYRYDARVLEVHDGDTCKLDVDLGKCIRGKDRDFGFHVFIEGGRLRLHETFRLFGINAPELKTQAGVDAQEYLRGMLRIGDEVVVFSKRPITTEKYGRWLAVIYLLDGTNVNEVMVGTGHAVEYNP